MPHTDAEREGKPLVNFLKRSLTLFSRKPADPSKVTFDGGEVRPSTGGSDPAPREATGPANKLKRAQSEKPKPRKRLSLVQVGKRQITVGRLLCDDSLATPGTDLNFMRSFEATEASSVSSLSDESSEVEDTWGLSVYAEECERLAVPAVAQVTEGLRSQTLDLHAYGMSVRGLSAVTQALKFNTTVTKLILSENDLNESALYALGELFRTSRNILELDISGNSLQAGTPGCAVAFKGLLPKAHDKPSLEVLVCRSNRLTDGDGAQIVQHVAACGSITHLDLGDNLLGARTFTTLASSIRIMPKLQALKLDSNAARSHGVQVLQHAIKQAGPGGCNLTVLDLSNNGIDAQGGAVLGTLLRIYPKLRVLAVARNPLGAEGVAGLAVGVASAINLETLDLDGVSLAGDAGAAMYNALHENVNLRKVSVRGCGLPDAELAKWKVEMAARSGTLVAGELPPDKGRKN
ncbi:unnamed protein product [Pedinophyceae sp. YPF-701]|nr:unnamed protein product [Pedinophyceae sp. YPF-701]